MNDTVVIIYHGEPVSVPKEVADFLEQDRKREQAEKKRDQRHLSSILGHTKASFTVDTYTHTTTQMHRKAAEIVGGFLTDYLGEEMAPWQNAENVATAAYT